ncbi:acyl carrier protein [Actinopolyspora xinjiangensis]|uniref:acyl carrier protein n=1 Tax=Actinopolyspora xinjiangensis TaxID=405564 RepID=UPI0014806D46|nr:acyl carrier protein [Actinopolyspora xinjiangensis]
MVEITAEKIIECVQEFSEAEIAEDTDIFSAGVDSLTILRCRARLKERTGVKIPGHVFFGGRTPAGIVDLIGEENADR